jgi:photosystem II stability/assembly factor-like uncharacterized protein
MKSEKNLLFVFVVLFLSSNIFGQWVQVGLTTNKIVSLGVKSNGDIYAGTYYNGLYRSTDTCRTWNPVLGSSSGVYQVLSIGFDSTGGVLAGSYKAGLFRSGNNGTGWSNLSNDGGLDTQLPVNEIYSIAVTPTGTILAVDGSSSVGELYKSTDIGVTWTRLLNPSYGVLSVAVNQSGTIFTGGSAYFYYSINNGDKFTWIGSSTGLTKAPLILAANGSGVFAGTSGGGIFYSSDNGENWSAVNTNLTSKYITALYTKGSTIIAGTMNAGIFVSTDNGLNWVARNTGLTDLNICSIVMCGNRVIIGTATKGIWSTPLSEIITSAKTINNASVAGIKIYTQYNAVFIHTVNPAEARIFDTHGRLILIKQLPGGNSNIELPKTGSYLIKVTDKINTVTNKVFIAN